MACFAQDFSALSPGGDDANTIEVAEATDKAAKGATPETNTKPVNNADLMNEFCSILGVALDEGLLPKVLLATSYIEGV